LNDRDFVHAAIYYLKMRLCHYVCARITLRFIRAQWLGTRN
jgi:hypothetical protein